MKHLLITLALLWPGLALAVERIPDEEARRIAKALIAAEGKIKPPLKVEVNPDKPFGKRHSDHAALVLPARQLSTEKIDKAAAEVVPVGEVWLRNLGPVVADRVVSSKRLQIVPVTYKDRELTLALCQLGVKRDKDRLVLVFLSKDRHPLLTLPLEKCDEKQELPLEFLVNIGGDDRAEVVLTILGKYRSRLEIGVLTE
jgi:hypothetical protein